MSSLVRSALLVVALASGCASTPKPPPETATAQRTLSLLSTERDLILAFAEKRMAVSIESNVPVERLVGLTQAEVAAKLGAPQAEEEGHWAYAFFAGHAGAGRTLALDFDGSGRCTGARWERAR
jgi:hypothetical protein